MLWKHIVLVFIMQKLLMSMLYFWKSVKTWFGFWTVTDELQCVAVKTMDD